eukprot:m.57060 g.57060  ORF g.57060 m.57060 type:complete len:328 (+) comp34681_c0_seq3:3-986(+)
MARVSVSTLALLTLFQSSFISANLADIADQVNRMNTTWRATKDNFRDVPLSVIAGMMGTLLEYTVSGLPRTKSTAYFIPVTFDARKAWPNCLSISDIRDQGACGSCWAFGAAEAMSDRYCIHLNMLLNISANELTACCRTCGNGCSGGVPFKAWNYWVEEGIVTGGQYGTHSGCQPYTVPKCEHYVIEQYPTCGTIHSTPLCTEVCENGYVKTFEGDKHYGETAYLLEPDVETIQAEIMENGPVETSFWVYQDFVTYKSGVYQHVTGSFLGGHASRILGWGIDNDLPYWLVANSWNPTWGDHGYFKILRGRNECGIESGVVAGFPMN